MKIFIINGAGKVSDSYHCDGGIAIVAQSREIALELANSKYGVKITEEEITRAIEYRLDEKENYSDAVYVFPDAGCC